MILSIIKETKSSMIGTLNTVILQYLTQSCKQHSDMTKKILLSITSILVIVIFASCDNKQEKSEINSDLSEAAKYCVSIASDSPGKVYNAGNFLQLCEMGGWSTNFTTAKRFHANAAYNYSNMAASHLDNASHVAYSIKADELMQMIDNARSNLQQAAQNFAYARDNCISIDYDHYIDVANEANQRAMKYIEDARNLLYE
jgi:hypothetical protein